MIAVFAQNQRDFENIRCMPSKNFKRIININSIRGAKFSGLICINGFRDNTDVKDAYDELYKRQPELFTLKLR